MGSSRTPGSISTRSPEASDRNRGRRSGLPAGRPPPTGPCSTRSLPRRAPRRNRRWAGRIPAAPRPRVGGRAGHPRQRRIPGGGLPQRQQPYRATAHHEKALSRLHLCAAHPMPGDRGGLDQASILHVQLRGQGQQRILRDHNRFGHAAVAENPQCGVAGFGASLGVTAPVFPFPP